MLKYQNALKTVKQRICVSLNLVKITKCTNRRRNVPEALDKLPRIYKRKLPLAGSVFGNLCKISSREIIHQKNGDTIGTFEIGPLEVGQGVTLGSTLRRAILGAVTGSAVTGFKINEALHEFSFISNVKEDMLEVASNLKALRITCGAISGSILGQLWASGPQIITGGMLNFPKNTAIILNPTQYICTVTSGVIRLDVEISNAAGYENAYERTKEASVALRSTKNKRAGNNKNKLPVLSESAKPTFLDIEANFTPIKAVSYKVKLGHDSHGILSDIVEFTVITNQTYSPRRAILEGAKEIMELFYPLILVPKLSVAVSGKKVTLKCGKPFQPNLIKLN